MLCVQSVQTPLNWLTSAMHETPYELANRALLCSQILLAQGRPQIGDRRIHSGVHPPLLAEIVGVTRPDDRTPVTLGLRLIRTVNEENDSGSHFPALELLPFPFALRLVYLPRVTHQS